MQFVVKIAYDHFKYLLSACISSIIAKKLTKNGQVSRNLDLNECFNCTGFVWEPFTTCAPRRDRSRLLLAASQKSNHRAPEIYSTVDSVRKSCSVCFRSSSSIIYCSDHVHYLWPTFVMCSGTNFMCSSDFCGQLANCVSSVWQFFRLEVVRLSSLITQTKIMLDVHVGLKGKLPVSYFFPLNIVIFMFGYYLGMYWISFEWVSS